MRILIGICLAGKCVEFHPFLGEAYPLNASSLTFRDSPKLLSNYFILPLCPLPILTFLYIIPLPSVLLLPPPYYTYEVPDYFFFQWHYFHNAVFVALASYLALKVVFLQLGYIALVNAMFCYVPLII